MLTTLLTLKSKPFQKQVDTIELLTRHNLDLFDIVRSLIGNRGKGSIFGTTVSADKGSVVRVALLAVVAADMASVPDSTRRGSHLATLRSVCGHFDIDYGDVVAVAGHAAAIEEALADRDA